MHKLFILFIYCCLTLPALSQIRNDSSGYRNLVFEGAGIRGIAYAGALEELEKLNVIQGAQRAGGNSAGAIMATLVACGYNAKEITALVEKMRMNELADGGGLFPGGIHRLNRNYGYYKGDKMLELMGEVIRAKTGKHDLTFMQLHLMHLENPVFKDLYITGTNVSRQCLTIFSHETFPHMEIRNAVRISTSIPLFFEAVRMTDSGEIVNEKSDKEYSLMIDGGIHANYPLTLFDQRRYVYDEKMHLLFSESDTSYIFNMQTLGLKMDSREQIEFDLANKGLSPYKIEDLPAFVTAFYTLVIENLNRPAQVPADITRTIYIDAADIGPRIRKLKPAQLQTLFNSGRVGVSKFYKRKKP